MAAVDAQFYWMSAKVPNDEFLLYAFGGQPGDLDRALDEIRCWARACPELTLRVEDGCSLTYPRWVPTTVSPEQVVRHDVADHGWQACLAAVARLADSQLDLRRVPWRLHVFTPVLGIPGVDRPGVVTVLQTSHALADGARGAALAGWLFGRDAPVPAVRRASPGCFAWRAAEAAWRHRGLLRDTRAGLLAPGVGSRPPLATNAGPDGARSIRTLVRQRAQLRGPSVTVAVLAAVSTALSRLLAAGSDALGAEVAMAKPGVPQANNHFGNIVVGIYPRLELDARLDRRRPGQRAAAIRTSRHTRGGPCIRRGARSATTLGRFTIRLRGPARAGVGQHRGVQCQPRARRSAVRGRAGGADGRLSRAVAVDGSDTSMGLTHGVHGIGETIAISVHTAESVIADMDTYLELLDAAL